MDALGTRDAGTGADELALARVEPVEAPARGEAGAGKGGTRTLRGVGTAGVREKRLIAGAAGVGGT